MVLTTKVGMAKSGSKSLKTTIPEGIAELLDLRAGVVIEWELDKDASGNWFARVIKREQVK